MFLSAARHQLNRSIPLSTAISPVYTNPPHKQYKSYHNSAHSNSNKSQPLHNRFAITILATALTAGVLYNTVNNSTNISYALDSTSEHKSDVQHHANQQAIQQTEKSESLYGDPRYPNIYRLTASTVDELVYNTNNSILVDIYEDTCGACKQTAPIIHLVAKCIKSSYGKSTPDTQQLHVAMYESHRNYKKSFLLPDEEIAVPVIKLYVKHLTPQQLDDIEQHNKSVTDKYDRIPIQYHPNGTVSLTYNGAPNAKQLIEFIHEYTVGSRNEFDINAALECVKKYDQQTYHEVQEQSKLRISDDPTAFLYDHSPCGNEFKIMLLRTMTHSYLSYPTSDDNKATTMSFNNVTNCLSAKHSETRDYWNQVAVVAQQNIQDLNEREKLDKPVDIKNKKKKGGKLNEKHSL